MDANYEANRQSTGADIRSYSFTATSPQFEADIKLLEKYLVYNGRIDPLASSKNCLPIPNVTNPSYNMHQVPSMNENSMDIKAPTSGLNNNQQDKFSAYSSSNRLSEQFLTEKISISNNHLPRDDFSTRNMEYEEVLARQKKATNSGVEDFVSTRQEQRAYTETETSRDNEKKFHHTPAVRFDPQLKVDKISDNANAINSKLNPIDTTNSNKFQPKRCEFIPDASTSESSKLSSQDFIPTEMNPIYLQEPFPDKRHHKINVSEDLSIARQRKERYDDVAQYSEAHQASSANKLSSCWPYYPTRMETSLDEAYEENNMEQKNVEQTQKMHVKPLKMGESKNVDQNGLAFRY